MSSQLPWRPAIIERELDVDAMVVVVVAYPRRQRTKCPTCVTAAMRMTGSRTKYRHSKVKGRRPSDTERKFAGKTDLALGRTV